MRNFKFHVELNWNGFDNSDEIKRARLTFQCQLTILKYEINCAKESFHYFNAPVEFNRIESKLLSCKLVRNKCKFVPSSSNILAEKN